MAMSRQNYNATAATVKHHLDMYNKLDRERVAIAKLVRDLAADFKADNSAFRYDRFFEACGLDSFGRLS